MGGRHQHLRHRLAAADEKAEQHRRPPRNRPGSGPHFFGHVLAHLTHRPAAGRRRRTTARAPRRARQMLRNRTATAPALQLRRHSRRFVWAFARRLVFFQFFQRQLKLADHVPELLRGSAEGLPFRTRQPSDDAYGEPNGRNTGEGDGAGGLVGAPPRSWRRQVRPRATCATLLGEAEAAGGELAATGERPIGAAPDPQATGQGARRHHHHRGCGRPVGHRYDPERHPDRGRGPRLRRRRSLPTANASASTPTRAPTASKPWNRSARCAPALRRHR